MRLFHRLVDRPVLAASVTGVTFFSGIAAAIQAHDARSVGPLRIAVLFDGAGLARLGLEQAGHECVGFELNEIAHYLGTFVGSGNSQNMDVLDVGRQGLLDNFDAVWASPPCQQRSAARRGHLADPKGLFCADFVTWSQTLRDRHPHLKYLWVENVIARQPGEDEWGRWFNAAQFIDPPIQNRPRIIGGYYPAPDLSVPQQDQYEAPTMTSSRGQRIILTGVGQMDGSPGWHIKVLAPRNIPVPIKNRWKKWKAGRKGRIDQTLMPLTKKEKELLGFYPDAEARLLTVRGDGNKWLFSTRTKTIAPTITASERGGTISDDSRASKFYGRKLTIEEAAFHMGFQIPKQWYEPMPDFDRIRTEYFRQEMVQWEWKMEEWRAGRLDKRPGRPKWLRDSKTAWLEELYRAIGNGVPPFMARAFGEAVYSGKRAKKQTRAMTNSDAVYRVNPEDEPVVNVDWSIPDNYDFGVRQVTADTIRDTYRNVISPHQRPLMDRADIYHAYIDADYLQEMLVEELDYHRYWGEDDEEEKERSLGELEYHMEELVSAGELPAPKVIINTDGTMEILDGNHRVRLWKAGGAAQIPVWVIDLRGEIKPMASWGKDWLWP